MGFGHGEVEINKFPTQEMSRKRRANLERKEVEGLPGRGIDKRGLQHLTPCNIDERTRGGVGVKSLGTEGGRSSAWDLVLGLFGHYVAKRGGSNGDKRVLAWKRGGGEKTTKKERKRDRTVPESYPNYPKFKLGTDGKGGGGFRDTPT